MNWCYDCIFQGVWKNTRGNAIIILSKNKISEFSLISSGAISVLCMALFVLRLLNSFMSSSCSTKRETQRQTRVTIFLYFNYATVGPIFYDFFDQWIDYVVTC